MIDYCLGFISLRKATSSRLVVVAVTKATTHVGQYAQHSFNLTIVLALFQNQRHILIFFYSTIDLNNTSQIILLFACICA